MVFLFYANEEEKKMIRFIIHKIMWKYVDSHFKLIAFFYNFFLLLFRSQLYDKRWNFVW